MNNETPERDKKLSLNLVETILSHYRWEGSTDFLDTIISEKQIKLVDLFIYADEVKTLLDVKKVKYLQSKGLNFLEKDFFSHGKDALNCSLPIWVLFCLEKSLHLEHNQRKASKNIVIEVLSYLAKDGHFFNNFLMDNSGKKRQAFEFALEIDAKGLVGVFQILKEDVETFKKYSSEHTENLAKNCLLHYLTSTNLYTWKSIAIEIKKMQTLMPNPIPYEQAFETLDEKFKKKFSDELFKFLYQNGTLSEEFIKQKILKQTENFLETRILDLHDGEQFLDFIQGECDKRNQNLDLEWLLKEIKDLNDNFVINTFTNYYKRIFVNLPFNPKDWNLAKEFEQIYWNLLSKQTNKIFSEYFFNNCFIDNNDNVINKNKNQIISLIEKKVLSYNMTSYSKNKIML